MAHTACSREDPTPKLGPATRIDAPAYCSSLDALQPLGGDDLIGVDIAATQRNTASRDHMY
jgi:hypothetical protein